MYEFSLPRRPLRLAQERGAIHLPLFGGRMKEGLRMPNEIGRSLRKRMTSHEVKLWVQLRLLDEGHFRRQVPIGPYIVDFAEKTSKLVIEIDGS
jgi:very-short-patch-repair endonuclease